MSENNIASSYIKAEDMNNKSADAQEVTSETLQFLTFAVGAEQYGISITTVREIKSWEETTVLPNSPQFMRGVINLRGTVVPIFDLRSRFGQGETEIDAAKSVVIVIAIEDRQIGLLVDAVSDILDVDSSDIKNAPSSAEVNIEEAYINGLVSAGNKMVILLNTSNLFDVEGMQSFDHVNIDSSTNHSTSQEEPAA